MRELNAGDILDLSAIVGDVWEHVDTAMVVQAVQAKQRADSSQKPEVKAEAEAKAAEVGQHVIGVLLKHGREGLFEFMASMNEESLQEFRKRPVSDITRTLEAILASKEGRDFFRSLPGLLSGAVKS